MAENRDAIVPGASDGNALGDLKNVVGRVIEELDHLLSIVVLDALDRIDNNSEDIDGIDLSGEAVGEISDFFVHLLDSADGSPSRFHGDENLFGGDESVIKDLAEIRWAINEDEVVVVIELGESDFESHFAVCDLGDKHILERVHRLVRWDDIEFIVMLNDVIDFACPCRFNHYLMERRDLLIVEIAEARSLSESSLRISIDQKDIMALIRQRTSEVDRGSCLADSTCLI